MENIDIGTRVVGTGVCDSLDVTGQHGTIIEKDLEIGRVKVLYDTRFSTLLHHKYKRCWFTDLKNLTLESTGEGLEERYSVDIKEYEKLIS